MKYIIMTAFMALNLQAAQVPAQWMDFSSVEKSNLSLDELENDVQSLMSLQEEMLDQSERDSNKLLGHYKIADQKTDFAISKSGLFGLSALSGASTVELTWTKKKEKSDELNEDAVELNDEMSEEQLKNVLEAQYDLILKRISDTDKREKVKEHWNEQAMQIHRALQSMNFGPDVQYNPVKFRIDLTASYSSPMFGLTKLSGDARVRLEWAISKKAQKSDRVEKLVNDLSEDISDALKDVQIAQVEGYKFDQISVGVGLNKKSLFSLSKVKGGIGGMLFFKRQEMKEALGENKLEEGSYTFSDDSDDKVLFKRSHMRKGIKRSAEIGNWFAKRLGKRSAAWEVSKFKVNFTLNKSGLFGLSTIGGSSEVELYYKK